MYTFKQSTAEFLKADGSLLGVGASGQGKGLNNHDAQDQHAVGPLPVGLYTIGEPYRHPRLGVITMNLQPDPGNDMLNRAGFRIHGFAQGCSPEWPGTSSEGCICLERDKRTYIADNLSSDNQVTVVE